jgi:hypothetical protein
MEILRHVVVLLHLLGLAAIIGSAVFVARGAATPALVWGARAQLVTGLVLLGILESGTDPVNHAKYGVKLVIALAVVACAEIANAKGRKGEARPELVTAAGALAILNAAVAVLWDSADAS